MEISNPTGLYALFILVPFVIIYLIRPKPKDIIIPSLMFLMRKKQIMKQNALFRTLLRNMLFFLQLLILGMLAFSAAKPTVVVPYSVSSDNTVLIIDASASMQAKYGTGSRFDAAIAKARDNLGGKTSIILAQDIPEVVLKKGNVLTAANALSGLKCKATTTNIGDALVIADDILADSNGKVVVLSDFIQTAGADPLVAKRRLLARGNEVEFIQIKQAAKNIGIIDLDITKHNTRAYIKNYNDNDERVNVLLKKGEADLGEKQIDIQANSIESILFDTPAGLSSISFDIEDGLPADNIAYLSAPTKKQNEVLLITNNHRSSLQAALESSQDIRLSVSHPPLSHMVGNTQINFNDFDVIIMQQVGVEGDKEGLLKGHIRDLKNYADSGGKLVIAGQIDLKDVATSEESKESMENLLPIDITGVQNNSRVCFKVFNQFTDIFKENSCGVLAEAYLQATAKNSTVIIAEANDNSPIIAYRGNVFYYGILDDRSDFKTLSSYPIFWNDLINFFCENDDISEYNYKTSDMIIVPEQEITTPSKKTVASKLALEEAGIYSYGDKNIAVNLLDEKESDISAESTVIEQDKSSFLSGDEIVERELNLEPILIILGLLLIFVEFIFLKRRGEL